MPRYVVLRHELPPDAVRRSHWDLMLETGNVLRTWALDDLPDATREALADELPPHRLAYLTYEGPVSGNRGRVHRWDEGEYRIAEQDDDRVVVDLRGERLQGRLTLRRCASAQRWRVSLEGG